MKLVLIQRKNLRKGARREHRDFLMMTLMTWRKVPASLANPVNLVVDQCIKVKLEKLLDYKASQKSIFNSTKGKKVPSNKRN